MPMQSADDEHCHENIRKKHKHAYHKTLVTP